MHEPFFRFLETIGDGTGDKNAVGDYSVTPQNFLYRHPADSDVTCELSRLIVEMGDGGPGGGEGGASISSGYGVSPDPLVNGIVITLLNPNGSVLRDLTDGIPIKTNADWARFCYNESLLDFKGIPGQGPDALQARWDFRETGHGLHLKRGGEFVIALHDDFSALTAHTFNLQGIWG